MIPVWSYFQDSELWSHSSLRVVTGLLVLPHTRSQVCVDVDTLRRTCGRQPSEHIVASSFDCPNAILVHMIARVVLEHHLLRRLATCLRKRNKPSSGRSLRLSTKSRNPSDHISTVDLMYLLPTEMPCMLVFSHTCIQLCSLSLCTYANKRDFKHDIHI